MISPSEVSGKAEGQFERFPHERVVSEKMIPQIA